jgi:hypothetical protein
VVALSTAYYVRRVRVKRFATKTINIIIKVRDAINENHTTKQSFKTELTDLGMWRETTLDSSDKSFLDTAPNKAILLKNPKDYIKLHDFFRALIKREKELNENNKLEPNNKTCLELATKALDETSWDKLNLTRAR